MKVHIIVPVYNSEEFICDCLDSLLNQTYKDIEIIAVDDESEDNSLKILKDYASKHEQIVVISQKNGGPALARNAGLSYLKANNTNGDDGVVFVDADDWVEPKFIEALASSISDEVRFAACSYKWQKPTKKHFKNKNEKTITLSRDEMLSQMFIDKIWVTPWNKIFVYKYINTPFRKVLHYGEDMDFVFDYLISLPKESKTKFVDQKLYHYIRRNTSLSAFKFNPKKLEVLTLFQNMKERLKSTGDLDVLTYVEAWEFLMCFEFLVYTRKGEHKELHKKLKQHARTLLKSYKQVRRQYSPFRRYANLALWMI